ncbi:AAA family ATPase [Ascidiaceihabitans sp.]|uniref:AAA family ATPase n=1 Tax=Ascidiaceihabitans sp. TaxID=1872644 RepID=UPI003297DD51
MSKLISFSGLPGTGKSSLAVALAKQTRAIYLDVASINASLTQNLQSQEVDQDAAYCAAQAVAETNLKLRRSVIIDAINPTVRFHDMWAHSAKRSNSSLFWVTLTCSDFAMHRDRIAARNTPPIWPDVQRHPFDPHPRPQLNLDTAKLTPDACLMRIMKALKDYDRKLLKGM